jgi:putative redox protein
VSTTTHTVMNARLELASIESGLHFKATTGNVAFDLDSGPEVTSPSPVQVVLVAVGACTGMDVISILRKKRQQVTAYAIAVTGERATEHPKVFTKIEVLHRFTGHDLKPAAVEEAIRLSEEKYCSVHAMMRCAVGITSRFEIAEA